LVIQGDKTALAPTDQSRKQNLMQGVPYDTVQAGSAI